jgi:hypothetical protein
MTKTLKLTKKEADLCKYLVQGCTKAEAYVRAYNPHGRDNMTNEQLYQAAHRVTQRPKVMQRLDELLAAARDEDILSTGRVLRMLVDGIELARDQGNMSAYAAMVDRALKHKGLMADRLHLTSEGQMSDAQLIESLCVGRPELRDQLAALLASESGFTH